MGIDRIIILQALYQSVHRAMGGSSSSESEEASKAFKESLRSTYKSAQKRHKNFGD